MAASMRHIKSVKKKSNNKASAHSLTEIKTKAKEFIENRKCANNLIDVISFTQSDSEDEVLASVRALHKVFTSLINTEQMYIEKTPSQEADLKDLDKEDQYKVWLRDRYADTRSQLVQLLSHQSNSVQELCLCTLMKFIAEEGNTPLKKIPDTEIAFPAAFFQEVVTTLLSSTLKFQQLLVRFQEFLEYDDVRYFSMKCALKTMKNRPVSDQDDIFHQNIFTLLENLSMPPTANNDSLSNFFTKLPENPGSEFKICSLKEHKKLFTKVWLDFLSRKLNTSMYKQVLVNIHEKVMPHMTSPLLLADFLTESYNIGGAISLLALNGLFILINTYNLNYPDFYGKLYALLEPSAFHAKYRARFFFLLDLFLTSTHLPAYLVAAFAKKLSRLSLTAPPSGLTVIIPLVYNLISRHPNCSIMVHRPDSKCEFTQDPFVLEEADPAKCQALQSSLWELQTLQSHYYHRIATEAKKVDQPLPTRETDISDLLETTVDDLIEKEQKKKTKEDFIPLTFEEPKGLFGNKEDQFCNLWALE